MNKSLAIVLVTVMINMMGVGLAYPILPGLIRDLSEGTLSDTALLYGAMSVSFALMQFLFAPLMGALSDRYGRRPVMLICLGALGLDNLLLAVAPTIGLALAARMIGGVFASTVSIANAYIADTTTGADRAKGFGYIGAAFGVGFIIGPIAGGILGEIDVRLPFYAAAALSFLNVILGWFFLKETLPPEKRSTKSLKMGNPISAIVWLGREQALLMLGIALFLASTMQRGLEALWVLFTEVQYGWGVFEAGLSLALVGVCFVVVQGFLIGPIVKRFGEMQVMLAGFSLSAALYTLLAFNTSGVVGFWGIVPHVLGWGCATPALQAIASQITAEDEQGYLQGALNGINGLCAIVGPAVATFIFAKTAPPDTWNFPGAFFLLGAILFISAVLVGSRARTSA